MTGKKKGALYEHLNYRMGDFVLVGNQGVTFRCTIRNQLNISCLVYD